MSYPDWFKAEPGFKFIDGDCDLVVVLGGGRFTQYESSGSVDLHGHAATIFDVETTPTTLVGSFFYKGEWHLIDLEDEHYNWSDAKPYTEDGWNRWESKL